MPDGTDLPQRFSARHGFGPEDREITVRTEAPPRLRSAVVPIAYEAGLSPKGVRTVVCRVLRVREDADNWSDFPNIDGESRDHLDRCEWYEVYETIEGLYAELARQDRFGTHRPPLAPMFATEINKLFRQLGIGWQLEDGKVVVRGQESFEQQVHDARSALDHAGRSTASTELHEALRDLSRRPDADVTGAVQHALAAIECVARDVTGDSKATLGDILKKYPRLVPPPLDDLLKKAWGFASEQGRHLQEGRPPEFAEAELLVGIAGATCLYLVKKLKDRNPAG